MNQEIENMLEEEIRSEIENLSNMDDGSKEKALAVENVATLYRVKLEQEDKWSRLVMDQESHEKETRKGFIMIVLDGVKIVLPVVVWAIFMNKGFKFEETGVVGSHTFKGLWSKINPFK